MAEFKVTRNLDAEVNSLAAGGEKINQSYKAASSDGVGSLSAAMAFIEEQNQIKELLTLYASLVKKDSQDLTAMIANVRQTDEKIGTAVGT